MAKEKFNRSGPNNPAYKHGCSVDGRTPEYRVWRGINQRCHSKTCKDYPKYGGRGIFVCDKWRHDFSAFLSDMGEKPKDMDSIDRIDNDGPYSPDNCHWVTHTQQNRNRRFNRLITYKGETKCLTEWAEVTGLHPDTIGRRIKVGWSVHNALTTPRVSGRRHSSLWNK